MFPLFFSFLLYLTPLKGLSWVNTYYAVFDGSGSTYASAASNVLSVHYTTNFSWSFWFNYNGSVHGRNFMDNGYYESNGYEFLLDNSNHVVFNAQARDGSSLQYYAPTPTAGAWHHVVYVWNGTVGSVYSDQNIYIDGVNQSLTSVQSGLDEDFWTPAVGVIYTMGVRGDGNSPFFGGIDEVGFYTTALTQAQVTALYNNGHTTNPATLNSWANNLSYYRNGDLTDNSTTIHDIHSTNNLTWTGSGVYSTGAP